MTSERVTPEKMILEHRRRHNVMAGHYWMELANAMAAEMKTLSRENRELRKALAPFSGVRPGDFNKPRRARRPHA